MDQRNGKITLSPSTLTERRGKPELQLLEPAPSLKSSSSSHRRLGLQTSISSVGSAASFPTISDTSDMISNPATPTELHWYYARMLDGSHGLHGQASIGGEEYRGLGSNVNDGARHAAAFRLSQKLQTASEFEEPSSPRYGSRLHRNLSDAKRAFRMPPTPPSHAGEEFYDELRFPEQDLENFSLDEESFSSEPPTPASPSSQSSYSRNRRAAFLSKVLPQRLRENIKRRISGQTNHVNQAHSHSISNTEILESRPRTPPPIQSDWSHYFEPVPSTESISPMEPIPDPQFILPIPTTSLRQRGYVHSPLQSPRTHSLSLITDIFPEAFEQDTQNEVVRSPLQPPSISPLASPTVSIPLTSLNMMPPLRPEEQNVPSIDPTTTIPSRKALGPIDLMSSDTISNMTAEMDQDDEAYAFIIQRMMNHGWSSAEEIKNLEFQRKECREKWQRKIAGAKRVLDGLSKCGFSTPYEFPQRSVKSMDTAWSDGSPNSPATSHDIVRPGSFVLRTYSQ